MVTSSTSPLNHPLLHSFFVIIKFPLSRKRDHHYLYRTNYFS
ncbi:hypothetical protein DDD_0399 [Nonlabens dokdonensis DSW-6]|uniref:Uncharacterized protein n=1 Tax=Nonlabens dokdonensis (strain DSM 17205 / KCTC 12402 / DSW-6) TaxID=592029 RepID=L7W6V6_NONDD|nr:hypothetical protein DDD_0399 [Nonlabens dokdonensis DSW-6]